MLKRSRFLSAFVAVLLGAFLFGSAQWAAAEEREEEEHEQKLELKQVPPAVRITIKRESFGGRITEIEKEKKGGRVVYEVDVKIGRREYELIIAPNGTLLVKKLEAEEEEEGEEHEAREREEHEEHARGKEGREREERAERGRERKEHEGRSREREERGRRGRVRVFNFDKDKPGTVPRGWKVAETAGQGQPAKWQVIRDKTAPTPPNAVAIVENKNYGHTFNLLIAKKTRYRDLKLSLRVKAIAGREDQGGGPIWRAKNGDNYYICRWNPLEKNFRVYYVKNGRRRQIASARIDADTSKWHTIEIIHQGTRITAKFDGKKYIEVSDRTFLNPGMVGLWVKADGRSAFDSLKVQALKGGRERRDRDEDEDN